mmetsp:Transcript_6833/g.17693  ORF Transcript_6833/g.17693 Transcript_6833/m.17693 type:complete len:609 (-) Transcript_6833:325-2151(-)
MHTAAIASLPAPLGARRAIGGGPAHLVAQGLDAAADARHRLGCKLQHPGRGLQHHAGQPGGQALEEALDAGGLRAPHGVGEDAGDALVDAVAQVPRALLDAVRRGDRPPVEALHVLAVHGEHGQPLGHAARHLADGVEDAVGGVFQQGDGAGGDAASKLVRPVHDPFGGLVEKVDDPRAKRGDEAHGRAQQLHAAQDLVQLAQDVEHHVTHDLVHQRLRPHKGVLQGELVDAQGDVGDGDELDAKLRHRAEARRHLVVHHAAAGHHGQVDLERLDVEHLKVPLPARCGVRLRGQARKPRRGGATQAQQVPAHPRQRQPVRRVQVHAAVVAHGQAQVQRGEEVLYRPLLQLPDVLQGQVARPEDDVIQQLLLQHQVHLLQQDGEVLKVERGGVRQRAHTRDLKHRPAPGDVVQAVVLHRHRPAVGAVAVPFHVGRQDHWLLGGQQLVVHLECLNGQADGFLLVGAPKVQVDVLQQAVYQLAGRPEGARLRLHQVQPDALERHLHVASAEQAEVLVVAAQLHPEVQLPAGGAVLAGALLQGEPLVVGLAVHVLHHRDAHLSHADVGGELLVVPQLHDEHVCGGDLAERDRLLPHWVQRALLHRSLVGLLP